MKTSVVAAVAALALGLAPPPRPNPDDEAKADLKKMQGVWVLENSVDGYGQSSRPPKLPPVWIAGDRLEHGKGGPSYTLRLDPGWSPRRVDIEEVTQGGQGRVYRGIYRLEGDKLTLCFETAGEGRPDTFTAGTPGAVTEVYERTTLEALERERQERTRGQIFRFGSSGWR